MWTIVTPHVATSQRNCLGWKGNCLQLAVAVAVAAAAAVVVVVVVVGFSQLRHGTELVDGYVPIGGLDVLPVQATDNS